jgi:DNA topoisomerase-1
MAKNLVIVESPAKAKKINTFLGKDFIVKASVGHVRDLPQKKLGVDVKNDFEPEYVPTTRGKKVISELKAAAKGCENIYLAPDPDREGEAIAWHLYEALKKCVPDENFFRVTYNEITKSAILDAFKCPSKIDMNRVNSQQARRVLDRLVGYVGSPVVRKQIRGANSVGRVQTVALRLVVEREALIKDFNPQTYWTVGAKVAKFVDPRDAFTVKLAQINGDPVGVKERLLQKGAIATQEQLNAICAELEASELKVAKVITKEVQRRPKPPFITSSLQQAGSSFLSFAPARSMSIAQKLYESGLITYMRTDSFNIADSARDACQSFVTEQFGADYYPETPNFYKSKGAAQEAHEAIRPTDVSETPESLESKLPAEEFKLYRLIWRRFVASQMVPARIARRTVEVEAGQENTYLFRATASEIAFAGYMRASGMEAAADKKKEGEDGDEDADALPPLTEGEGLEKLDWLTEQKETKPPSRFTEASLIKVLEENGVGRPSTYAAIMSKLDEREYVTKEKRALIPTELGWDLIQLVEKTAVKLKAENGTDLFDAHFTADMELQLDKVEEGSVEWTQMLGTFYPSLEHWIEDARETADTHVVGRVLQALSHVTEWAEPVQRGRRVYDDQKTVTDLKEQVAEGKKLSLAQGNMLVSMAGRYLAQIPQSYANELRLEAPQPPRDDTAKKLALFAGIKYDEPREVGKRVYDDGSFIESIKEQVESGKRLSDRQIGALDRIIQKYANQIPNFEEVKASFGIEEAAPAEADPSLGQIIGLMAQIPEWNPAKGRFDDEKFYKSLKTQFESRGALSPKQAGALKKMVARYSAKIPNYAAVYEELGLPAPKEPKEPKAAE